MENLSDKVKKANIEYHTLLAPVYNQTQPHFSKENEERVRAILCSISDDVGHKRFLDVGTGTGFLLNIAKDIFDEVIGIDITNEMLKQIPKCDNVTTIISDSESLPFCDGYFDVCGAYSFLHHLSSLSLTLKEIHRVLKVGGVIYTDQDHNSDFLSMSCQDYEFNKNYYELLEAKKNIVSDVSDKYGIPEDIVRLAEYRGIEGMTLRSLHDELGRSGFVDIKIHPRWFFGEGVHDNPDIINSYLIDTLPLSIPYFKYIMSISKRV